MAGRYLVGNAVFLAHAALECARQRGWQERIGAAAKRLFDIAGASLALLALLPLFLLTAIAIRMEDRGPVFFRQQRVGAGDYPDIALFPQPGGLFDIAEQGVIVPIDVFLDYDALAGSLITGFLDSARLQGRVYGAPMRMACK